MAINLDDYLILNGIAQCSLKPLDNKTKKRGQITFAIHLQIYIFF